MTSTAASWKEDLQQLQLDPVWDKGRLHEAQRLVRRHLPGGLYRFRRIDDRTLSNLRNGVEWFSRPEGFNDPHDSAILIESQQPFDEHLRKNVDTIVRQCGLSELISDAEYHRIRCAERPWKEFVAIALSRVGMDTAAFMPALLGGGEAVSLEMSRSLTRLFTDRSQAGLRVCCFSETRESPALWAHYGDNHKGLCIRYDFGALANDDPRILSLFPVLYSEQVFDGSPFLVTAIRDQRRFNLALGIACAVVKSAHWAFEREWRIVLPLGDDDEGLAIPMPRPTAVYLGCKASAECVEQVREVADALAVPIFSMTLDRRAYALRPSAPPVGR